MNGDLKMNNQNGASKSQLSVSKLKMTNFNINLIFNYS